MGCKSYFWMDITEQFNLQTPTPAYDDFFGEKNVSLYTEHGVNPGPLNKEYDNVHVYNLWTKIRRLCRPVFQDYDSSGRHNQTDFVDFIRNRSDFGQLLITAYMFELKDEEAGGDCMRFINGGVREENSLDTSKPNNTGLNTPLRKRKYERKVSTPVASNPNEDLLKSMQATELKKVAAQEKFVKAQEKFIETDRKVRFSDMKSVLFQSRRALNEELEGLYDKLDQLSDSGETSKWYSRLQNRIGDLEMDIEEIKKQIKEA